MHQSAIPQEVTYARTAKFLAIALPLFAAGVVAGCALVKAQDGKNRKQALGVAYNEGWDNALALDRIRRGEF